MSLAACTHLFNRCQAGNITTWVCPINFRKEPLSKQTLNIDIKEPSLMFSYVVFTFFLHTNVFTLQRHHKALKEKCDEGQSTMQQVQTSTFSLYWMNMMLSCLLLFQCRGKRVILWLWRQWIQRGSSWGEWREVWCHVLLCTSHLLCHLSEKMLILMRRKPQIFVFQSAAVPIVFSPCC